MGAEARGQGVARSADGIAVHFDLAGSGEPAVVFVHGWSCDRSYWRRQMEHFAPRHQVVAIDLAGHGDSGLGRSRWTMPAFGDDVVAVIEKVRLSRVVLVGHSMGGDVIVEAARQLPDRVAGLVWIDTYTSLGRPRSREEVEAFAAAFRVDFEAATRDFVRRMFAVESDGALVERIADDMSAAPPEVAVDALVNAFRNDEAVLAGLRELTVPVVAINSDFRPTDVESLQRHGVEAVVVPGTGHFPMLEAPDTFNRTLSAVLERLAR